MSPRQRILLVVYGPIAERMSAPEIRGWEMAKVLTRCHDLTVAAPGELHDGRDGIRMVASDRRTLLAEARRHDVLIVPRVPPYLVRRVGGQRDADHRRPLQPVRGGARRAHREPRDPPRDLAHARGEPHAAAQRRRDPVRGGAAARALGAALDALGPIRRRPPVEVVAFGLPEDPPPSDVRPMRERFPQIGADDVVVLWWGNVWRWFDAPTALRAFARVAARRPDVRLVFTAGKHPRRDWPVLDASAQARDLAAEMGLLDRSVFFLDDWVPQEQRHHYLLEADVGLTLHRDTAETAVAARGRYMDYVWAGLPCVLGAGDVLADRFAEAGFATTVASRGVATAGRRVPLFGDRAAAPRRT
jgi:glycosyltransferase involved in cell wall biosynthesis